LTGRDNDNKIYC
jgi:dynein heavy chain